MSYARKLADLLAEGTNLDKTLYLGDGETVTASKIDGWDDAAAWHQTMTTADSDNVINTLAEIVTVLESHTEGLNLITELDAKLTASSTINGGTF